MDLELEFPLVVKPCSSYERIYSADEVLVAFIGMRPNSKAIAAFIARACNSHDQLVRALAAAYAILDTQSLSTNNLDGYYSERSMNRLYEVTNLASETLRSVGINDNAAYDLAREVRAAFSSAGA